MVLVKYLTIGSLPKPKLFVKYLTKNYQGFSIALPFRLQFVISASEPEILIATGPKNIKIPGQARDDETSLNSILALLISK